MLTAILIAIGLNFDTFSIAIAEGTQTTKNSLKDSLLVGVAFTLGHVTMLCLGFFLGISFKMVISNLDHWIAFLLLSLVGGKMVKDSFLPRRQHCRQVNLLNIKSLFLLVIAASIDALVIGISLAFLRASLFINALIIALITMCVATFGFYSGKKLKRICKTKAKMIGGLILIAIGLKILFQHLFFPN